MPSFQALSAAAGRWGVDGRDGSAFGQPGETRADGPGARNSAGAMHAAIGRQATQRFSGTVRGTIQSYGGFPAGPAGAVTAKMTAADEARAVR